MGETSTSTEVVALGHQTLSLNRRALLGAGAALATFTGGSVIAMEEGFFAAHRLPIGLQLYTVGADLDRDFEGTLTEVAQIGFKIVELAGLHGRTPSDFRKAMDKAGLECPSIHIPPTGAKLSLHGDLPGVIDAAHQLGARCVVMPIFLWPKGFAAPSGPQALDMIRAAAAGLSADDYGRSAAFLNEIGAQLKRADLDLAYHNHNVELAPKDGRTGLEILLAETDPALVSFEMDIGWVAAAGADPTALFKAHPGRFRRAHLKDLKATTTPNFEFQIDPIEIGNGSIDWRSVLGSAYGAGVREFYVEQEPPYAKPPLVSAAENFKALLKTPAGKV